MLETHKEAPENISFRKCMEIIGILAVAEIRNWVNLYMHLIRKCKENVVKYMQKRNIDVQL